MPEVVNATTGNNVVPARKMQPLYQVLEQATVHFFVIHKTRWLAFAPVL